MRITAGVILAFLLGAMFLSLFTMSSGMDMTGGGMSDCPFMAHDEVICPMDLADHIGAWQSIFQAITPTIVLLLAVALAVVTVASVAPHLLLPKRKPIPLSLRRLRERTYSFSYRSLQELFSNGILHPKLF
ncbi:MAG: hypothetical protein R3B69_03755 [Candidatus Paceibacterota bacterium]